MSQATDNQAFGVFHATVEYLTLSDFPAVVRLNRALQSRFTRYAPWVHLSAASQRTPRWHILDHSVSTLFSLVLKKGIFLNNILWQKCTRVHSLKGGTLYNTDNIMTWPLTHLTLDSAYRMEWLQYLPHLTSLQFNGAKIPFGAQFPQGLSSLVLEKCTNVESALRNSQNTCLERLVVNGFGVEPASVGHLLTSHLQELQIYYTKSFGPSLKACVNLRKLRVVVVGHVGEFNAQTSGLDQCFNLEDVKIYVRASFVVDPMAFVHMKKLKRLVLCTPKLRLTRIVSLPVPRIQRVRWCHTLHTSLF
jgi:hypothetical protein